MNRAGGGRCVPVVCCIGVRAAVACVASAGLQWPPVALGTMAQAAGALSALPTECEYLVL